MKSGLKAVGGFGIIVLVPLALVLIAVLLIRGGVWLSSVLYPWLLTMSGLTLAFTVFVLLPNAIFSPVPRFAGGGMIFASWVFGATLWVWSLLLTHMAWGWVGLFIGLIMMGLGVVPLAMIATLFKGMWPDLGQLVLLLAFTVIVRMWGFRLLKQAERKTLLREKVSGESPNHEDFRRRLAAARSLTTAYSELLQQPRDHFWPLSALPADKETMKAALKVDAAFQASQGELDEPFKVGQITTTRRNTFISACAMLADFVSDDLAARVNPYWKFIETEGKRVTSGEQMDGMALAQGLIKVRPSQNDERECQKARDEWSALADEMRAYLDRIAPPKL